MLHRRDSHTIRTEEIAMIESRVAMIEDMADAIDSTTECACRISGEMRARSWCV